MTTWTLLSSALLLLLLAPGPSSAAAAAAAAAAPHGLPRTYASTLQPPVLPLVVRTPYLNTHLGHAREEPWLHWPMFWTDQEMGLSLMASVNRTVYPLLGRPHDSLLDTADYGIAFPTYLGAQYDASATNLTYQIPAPDDADNDEPLELTVSFLSPITPQSTMRQSLPASYVQITATGSFDVDVYMDLNGMWVTAESDAEIVWKYSEIEFEGSPSLKTIEVKRKHEMKFAEIRDRAEYGKLYFTAPEDATHQIGTSAKLRHHFAKHRSLQNEVDKEYRRVQEEEPVFAFHKSFSNLSEKSGQTSSALFTIAHVRDQVAQFASARGLTEMRPFWANYFLSDHEMLAYHYFDHEHAKKLANEWNTKILKDAMVTGGQDYADILGATARQVLGATDFTGTKDDPLLFIKEISSDGNCQTIDVIFPAWPFFAYANPRWLAYMLEPLLEHMLSGQYPNKYAMHDLGFSYPNLTGHPLGRDEYMPVEESGDMLIMGLNLVHSLIEGAASKVNRLTETFADVVETTIASGASAFPLRLAEVQTPDGIPDLDEPWVDAQKSLSAGKAWLKKSYRLWKQWTEYLVDYALEPENQLSTDDFAGWLPLQTNLALKGIVGIRAMTELSAVMGEKDDMKYYKNISDTYIKKWQDFGISPDGTHAKLAYNWKGSWTTLYSLFADSILCFHTDTSSSSASGSPLAHIIDTQGQQPFLRSLRNHTRHTTSPFIPHSVYTNQSIFYSSILQTYGLPLDQRHLYTKSDWAFQAASVASPSFKKEIIARTAKWLNETVTYTPFSDLYGTEDQGDYAPGTRFTARPVIGSHFAILAMQSACGGKALEGMEW